MEKIMKPSRKQKGPVIKPGVNIPPVRRRSAQWIVMNPRTMQPITNGATLPVYWYKRNAVKEAAIFGGVVKRCQIWWYDA